MKKIILSSLSIACLSSPSLLAQKTDLKEVTNQLDMDGSFFLANNIDGDIPKIAKLANDWIAQSRVNGKGYMPKGADAIQLMKDMGLDQFLAYGRSAKHNGDHWSSKMYWQTGGTNKGVFSLLGQNNQPLAVTQFAPKGSDLALEMNFDLRQLNTMSKQMAKVMPEKKAGRMTRFMERPLTQNMTIGKLTDQLNMQLSLVAKMDKDQRVVCPIYKEFNFPETHFCGRLKGANPLWEQFGPLSGFLFKSEKLADGTLKLEPLRKKKRWGNKKPVIIVDKANNLMWAASSMEFLKECQGDGEKLANDPSFNAISSNMTQANAMAYLSRKACLELRQVREAKMKKRAKSTFSPEYTKFMLDHVTESKNGYFASISKSTTGINFLLNAPCPLKDMLHMGKGCHRKSCKKKYSCRKGCGYGKKSDKGCGCKKGNKACGCKKGEKGCGCKKADKDCGCKNGDNKCQCEPGKCGCKKKTAPNKQTKVIQTKCPIGH